MQDRQAENGAYLVSAILQLGIQTDPNCVESSRDNSLAGAIVGAINGGQVRGRAVRIPRNTLLTFRIERQLDIGRPDRGVDRDR
jgi:hypothetical protein